MSMAYGIRWKYVELHRARLPARIRRPRRHRLRLLDVRHVAAIVAASQRGAGDLLAPAPPRRQAGSPIVRAPDHASATSMRCSQRSSFGLHRRGPEYVAAAAAVASRRLSRSGRGSPRLQPAAAPPPAKEAAAFVLRSDEHDRRAHALDRMPTLIDQHERGTSVRGHRAISTREPAAEHWPTTCTCGRPSVSSRSR